MTGEQLLQRFADKLDSVTETLAEVVVRIEGLTERLAALGDHAERIAVIETRLHEQEKRASALRWLLGLVSTAIVGLAAVAAGHLSWK